MFFPLASLGFATHRGINEMALERVSNEFCFYHTILTCDSDSNTGGLPHVAMVRKYVYLRAFNLRWMGILWPKKQ